MMGRVKQPDRNSKILMSVYSSSMGISMTALTIVAVLEVFMLVYSVVNASLYGAYIWNYRFFYITLLTVAVIYLALNAFVKSDIERRYVVLNIANPVYALFFYGWALGITYFDMIIWGTIDTMVFMTFSLTVPLSFYLLPQVYAIIVVLSDAVMMYLTVTTAGSVAPLINLSIFCIFQIVLGVSFLHLRTKLAERIVEEQENADIDVLTGFSNRRVYEQDIKQLVEQPAQPDLVYISIDLNGLKEVNDHFGHEAGDKLIKGAAKCIEKCFGSKGRVYRIGGDEFVALISARRNELDSLFGDFAASMHAWSVDNDMALNTAYGHACQSEYPDDGIAKLARVADERMYASKARYYQTIGNDRRRYHLDDVSSAVQEGA